MEMQPGVTDLVIIGGGLGGLTAGVRAAELGLRATLLEKGDGEQYPCNSRWSGGIIHVAMRDIRRKPDELYKFIVDAANGEVNTQQRHVSRFHRGISHLDDAGRRKRLDYSDGAQLLRIHVHGLRDACQHCGVHPGNLPSLDQRRPGRGRARMQRRLH